MTDTPRPRGVEIIGATVNDGIPTVTFFCDCGTVTEIVLQDASAALDAGRSTEFAYTCDGCESVHWVAVTRPEVRRSPVQFGADSKLFLGDTDMTPYIKRPEGS